MMMRLFLFAASLLVVWTIEATTASSSSVCPLNCPLDAPCVVVESTDDGNGSSSPLSFHCDCPPGWTGLLCDVKYESCHDNDNDNESVSSCYNGGKCVNNAAVDAFGNAQFQCDCSQTNGYVGKYCEHPSTQLCSSGTTNNQDNSDWFCVNGGACHGNYLSDGIACDCLSGYTGLHCEFDTTTTTSIPECTLDCHNQGTCVLGVRHPDEVQEAHDFWKSLLQEEEDATAASSISDYMRCVCPPGWGGPLCQVPQERCGDDNDMLFCYHGGQCVEQTTTTILHGQSSSSTNYYCDCTTATDAQGRSFAGEYCQVPSTIHCGNQKDASFFCTNGGNCPKGSGSGSGSAASSHEACLCPDGFQGHRCEYTSTLLLPQDEEDNQEEDTTSPSFPQDQDQDDEMGGEKCGTLRCLNGAPCIKEQVEANANVYHEYCDCSQAYNPSLYLAFAGSACQYQATSLCPSIIDDDPQAFCVHQGTCLPPPTDDADDNSQSYCDCPAGWTGPHCETPMLQEDDDDSSVASIVAQDKDNSVVPCGEDNVCYHGGKCVETSVTLQGEDGQITRRIEHYCDCSTAMDDDDDDHNGHVYAGKSCEYPSTSLCFHDEEDGSSNPFFCTNHGTCLLNELQQSCICPDGFSGQHCEYLQVQVQDDNDDSFVDLTLEETEAESNPCHGFVCRHGGTCVSTMVNQDGHIRQVPHCDCSTTATETTMYAGPQCEHAATSFCTDPYVGDGGSGMLSPTALFCVQGGKCRANVFEGCDCPPGWTGFKCEYPLDPQDIAQDFYDEDNDSDDIPSPIACGDKVCYNGGSCVFTPSDDGQAVMACDCSTAIPPPVDDDEDNHQAHHVFGGPTCSTKSTSVCRLGDENGAAVVCMNHGTCRSSSDGDMENGSWCDCTPGFTGKICDLKVDDDEHADQGIPCGDTYCYNGGRCTSVDITEQQTNVEDGAPPTTTTLEYCDCEQAFDDKYLYAGKSCEHKSTVLCTHPTSNDRDMVSLEGTLFCVNGGTCRGDGADDSFLQGCDCPSGWTGFSCEFEEDPQDALQDDDYDLSYYDPSPCGDYVCLNGGSCVTSRITSSDGTVQELQYCDCAGAFDEQHLYDGPNCEYPSSSLCTDPPLDSSLLAGTPFCVNGGTCNSDNVLGSCSCSSHWTGIRCELPVDQVPPQDNSEVCGDNGDLICLHGGRCELGEDAVYRCNCHSAMEHNLRYDGDSCQYPATEYCDNPLGGGDNGSSRLSQVDFCVNGGACRDGGTCSCPTGFYGPRCEMLLYPSDGMDGTPAADNISNDEESSYDCRLSCANGGRCVKGAKDHGAYHDAINRVAHLNMTFEDTFFEHCVCPSGYLGLTCEQVVETCGNSEHFCLHGSKCRTDDRGKPYCDCEDAQARIGGDVEMTTTFAGANCQHPASDICLANYGVGGPAMTQPLYFCVNEGRCRDYVTANDADPGCDCPEDWIGPHCEIHFSSSFMYDEGDDGPSTGLLVSVTLCLVLTLALLIVYARRLGQATSSGSASSAMNRTIGTDDEVTTSGRSSSFFRIPRRGRPMKKDAITSLSLAQDQNLAPHRRSSTLAGSLTPSLDPVIVGNVLSTSRQDSFVSQGSSGNGSFRFRDSESFADEEAADII